MGQLVEYYRSPDEPISLEDLKSFLWGTATRLHGQIDVTGYKEYIFPLLFFKRISDMYDEQSEGYVCKGGIEYANTQAQELVICIPDGVHWRDVREYAENVDQRLVEALIATGQANSGEYTDGRVIGSSEGISGPEDGWTSKVKIPGHVITSLIGDFSRYNLSLRVYPADEMGRAYGYLVGKFADNTGNTTQKFYTSRTVAGLTTETLQPRPGEGIYDPTRGLGDMLMKCSGFLHKKSELQQDIEAFGRGINAFTSTIARMNLYLNGIEGFPTVRKDALVHPAFVDGSKLHKFDIVLVNPSYSIKTWNREVFMNNKWECNFLGTLPQGRADYAFFQHILASMDDKTGRCAILFPRGALFRGEEQSLREKLIKSDVVECVIDFGANLFYNSPMETCILIYSNQKYSTLKNKIIFIDALRGVTREDAESYLERVYIEKIVSAYFNVSEIQNFSIAASLEQTANYNYNLNIPLYTDALNNENNFNVLSVSETLSNWESVHAEMTSSITEMFTLISK